MFKRRTNNQVVNSYFKPVTSMKINNIFKQSVPDDPPAKPTNSGISDSEGLSRAYNAPNSVYIDGNRAIFVIGL